MPTRDEELTRRFQAWESLKAAGGPSGVPASLVNDLRIYYGGRGIWRDKTRLKDRAPEGVTIGVLHTGRHLRHRRITTWMADQKHAVYVNEAVGHADLATTMNYTHLAREHLRSLVTDDNHEPSSRFGT